MEQIVTSIPGSVGYISHVQLFHETVHSVQSTDYHTVAS